MALSVVGGSFLSSFLNVLFDRMATREFVDLIKGRRVTDAQLNKLKAKMLAINGVLEDAEEKQITNSAVRDWLDQLKDALYEADDLLDEIAYKAFRLKMEAGSRTFGDQMRNFLASRNPFKKGMEEKLDEILDRLENLVKEKVALCLREGSGEKPSSTKVPSTSLVDESGVYGRDDDKEAMINLLLSDDANGNDLGVIPIVGMGGVGKTTLAQLVYNDIRVQEWFDVKAWVCVSEEFDVFKITRDVLMEVTSLSCDNKTSNQLQLELKERLKGKRFLLVLDDVWNDKYTDWEILQRPFKHGAQGSKIVITTRIDGVASIMQTVPPLHLKGLTDNDCWSLFAKIVFDDGNSSTYTDLEVIGRGIVSKCKGLPLAAKALGGLLRSKRDVEEWEKISKSCLWNSSNDDILPALRLSYHYLPSHLKRCFAYCAIFPKDHEFEKEELVHLWMAEGFLVHYATDKEMEEVGDEYFNDLVSRSFFQRSSGHHSYFIMHDLINDLAKYVSGEFCVRLDGDDSCKITKRTRHLSYVGTEYDSGMLFDGIYEAQFLRTFILMEWSCIDNETLILHECIYLAVLPDSIGNLKYLRFLDLSGTLIRRLPESLSGLNNLQTLILCRCKGLVELPTNMAGLINLRRLDIRGTKLQEMPPLMSELKNLHILTNFIVRRQGGGSNIKELGRLQRLREKLCIWNLENIGDAEDALEANLKGKKHLKELELRWNSDTDNSALERGVLEQLQPHANVEFLAIVGYGGGGFPDWVGDSSFSNIVSLKLSGCKYCVSLPPVGQLASLKDLSITEFGGIEVVAPEFYGNCTSMENPFRSLKLLKFERMPKWHKWIPYMHEDERRAFPVLQELYIRECPALTTALPSHLPSLTTLEIEGCLQLVASLPRAPAIIKMKLKDDFRDLLIKKLPSELHSLILDRFYSSDSILDLIGSFFSTLEEIEIRNYDSLKCFPLDLFPRLKSLRITRCPSLESLSMYKTPHENFTSLSSLEIRECPNLASFLKGRLPAPNLARILLLGFSNVESFPEKMLLPSSLISLKIWDFHNLKFLNYNGLQHLTYLRDLEICNCPKLQSLPEEGLPSSLSSLSIFLCPLLEQRCQKEQGEDWAKISHIPHVKVNFHKIN
ncbi:putative disease resistance RPP13-like protein 1 isoform X2 [Manihot esculenta]|uniref:Uncharacterized protein n=1 Tax=Manihot esculenta TaxID=3983 RepID=A0ACB7HHK6_MANES|nr:putative disease resistance RPP13-like protein 1 isoform X2 [Manihot esculenta]KAG8651278.1 hypothetical protein MANES_07G107800v8 [Manihot esculenta]